MFHLAVAAAVEGDGLAATDALRQAHELDPDKRAEWITRLVDLGAVHPSVYPLIKVLAEAGQQ